MIKLLVLILIIIGAIGFIAGFIKGYTNTKIWASVYVCTTISTVATIKALSAYEEVTANDIVYTSIVFGCTIVYMLAFLALFKLSKRAFKKGIERRQQLSYYTHYEEAHPDEAAVIALEDGDRKEYKKVTRRNFKPSSGAIGVVSRIVGGVNVAVKSIVMVGLLGMIALFVLDLTGLQFPEQLEAIYATRYYEVFSRYTADCIVVGITMLCLGYGYKNGILDSIGGLLKIAIVVGSFVLTFFIAFKTQVFIDLAHVMQHNMPQFIVKGVESIYNMLAGIEFTSAIAKFITMENVCQGLLWIGLSLIVLAFILIGFHFAPAIYETMRKSATIKFFDGILGAVVTFAVVMGILAYLGATFFQVVDAPLMQTFNTYFKDAYVGSVVYSHNIITALLPTNWYLPLQSWLINNVT